MIFSTPCSVFTALFLDMCAAVVQRAAIEDYTAKASKAVIDYGFHLVINDPSDEVSSSSSSGITVHAQLCWYLHVQCEEMIESACDEL